MYKKSEDEIRMSWKKEFGDKFIEIVEHDRSVGKYQNAFW